ncbi:M48 family metalloprotease [Erythrobacter sp. SCSIO 43205]|uniref:M48 family metallopeptidase n=1 Tax=Erythrobacter sp. SCSIO 43205 TaxID=2779361 RepID=UPI001CA8E715|nr:M48 family metallopeptidase [Erythrobacter sp. SCSIO 43205]UAB79098.1 M48 family metalloprotease [Erythrobacter sp. SCSIO 43205]
MRLNHALSPLALGAALAFAGHAFSSPVLAQDTERDQAVSGEAAVANIGGSLNAGATLATPQATLPAFEPQDDLERSLWQRMDEYERELKKSNQVIDDPELNQYVRDVLCRTVGPECAHVRLYILRSPQFNATMAPNGVMTVWSGLMLRAQNEAQLATVLGHEFSHFKRRHSVQLFVEAKNKSSTAAWLALTGVGLLFAIGVEASIYQFSREMEEEADLDGLYYIRNAGYDPRQSPLIWEQILSEDDATREARGRKKKRRSTRATMGATHPKSQARVNYLNEAIAELGTELPDHTGAAEYRKAMAEWWPRFLDDQLKRNDHGGSEFLIERMGATNGWTPWLTYARAELHRKRGEAGDFEQAVTYYTDAIERGGELPEIWRGRGYALRKLDRNQEARDDFREYLTRVPDAPDRGMILMLAGGN